MKTTLGLAARALTQQGATPARAGLTAQAGFELSCQLEELGRLTTQPKRKLFLGGCL